MGNSKDLQDQYRGSLRHTWVICQIESRALCNLSVGESVEHVQVNRWSDNCILR